MSFAEYHERWDVVTLGRVGGVDRFRRPGPAEPHEDRRHPGQPCIHPDDEQRRREPKPAEEGAPIPWASRAKAVGDSRPTRGVHP
jgi:hypothetical protein